MSPSHNTFIIFCFICFTILPYVYSGLPSEYLSSLLGSSKRVVLILTRVPTGAFHVSGLLNFGLLAGRGGVVDTSSSSSSSGVLPSVSLLLIFCASRLAASLNSCFSSSPSFNSFNDFTSFWSASTSACNCSVCAYSGMYAFPCILADTCTSSELSCSISLSAASCTEAFACLND